MTEGAPGWTELYLQVSNVILSIEIDYIVFTPDFMTIAQYTWQGGNPRLVCLTPIFINQSPVTSLTCTLKIAGQARTCQVKKYSAALSSWTFLLNKRVLRIKFVYQ